MPKRQKRKAATRSSQPALQELGAALPEAPRFLLRSQLVPRSAQPMNPPNLPQGGMRVSTKGTCGPFILRNRNTS